jgi:hypothetical protein
MNKVWYWSTLALAEQGLWSVLSDWLGILIARYISNSNPLGVTVDPSLILVKSL